jgi:2',3'-cyclic-nucleotide 2'-phosphodiesterase (5'-nucleotidase family)
MQFISKIIFCALLLGACHSNLKISTEPNKIAINNELGNSDKIEKIVTPFKDSLDKVMNQIIAFATVDYISKRPGSNLMNWSADALLAHQTRNVKMNEPVMVLLNTGGLRSTLNKGDISLGDIFKLMPFDNQVVWARLPKESLNYIAQFIQKSGGEPIANVIYQNGELIFGSSPDSYTHFWVITSDYLFNGGDKMNFFKEAIEVNQPGVLLRDVFIEEAKFQGKLILNEEIRCKFP